MVTQSGQQIYGMVRAAIVRKDVVVASYRGYAREMCLRVIGTKNGRAQALLYQFAGGSKSGLKPDGSPDNWRCLQVDELADVSVRSSAGEWHTASNYSTPQTCVDQVDVKIEIG